MVNESCYSNDSRFDLGRARDKSVNREKSTVEGLSDEKEGTCD